MKTKIPNLMTGSLWFVYENEDGTKPNTLKEFNNNISFEEKISHLTRGTIVPKDLKVNEHIKFDCFRPEYNESSFFKLFLYGNNIAEGWVTYNKNLNYAPEYFKGSYKKHSNSEITLWGTWEYGVDRKQSALILIEFKKGITEEIENIKIANKKRNNQIDILQINKVKFFEPHTNAELKKMHKVFSQSLNNFLYIPIQEELERRAYEKKLRH